MKIIYLTKGLKALCLILIISLAFLTITSCNKDDSSTASNDNYYYKYVITGNGTYGRFSNWTATTPQGVYSNNGIQVTGWTQTYGPVSKGFLCKVQIGSFIWAAPTIDILVSKNQEPFALKVSQNGNSASYIIN